MIRARAAAGASRRQAPECCKRSDDNGCRLILARLVIGTLMAAHGAQKLFGWFGGYGLTGTGGFFEGLGFRPGRFFAAAAAARDRERHAGRPRAARTGRTGVDGVGDGRRRAQRALAERLFAQSNGIEVPLLYGVAAAALALTGLGAYSLDNASACVALDAGAELARPRRRHRRWRRQSRPATAPAARGARQIRLPSRF